MESSSLQLDLYPHRVERDSAASAGVAVGEYANRSYGYAYYWWYYSIPTGNCHAHPRN